MKITRTQVEHIAHLARLEFNENDLDDFTHQMNGILAYFDKLSAVDTSAVEPTSHAIKVANVFREDQTAESLSQESTLANASDRENGLFRVPKIIE